MIRRYWGRVPRPDQLATSAVFAALVVLAETYHLAVERSTFVPALGGAFLSVLGLYLLAAAFVIAIAIRLSSRPLAPTVSVAVFFYGVTSVKVLGIDADFLGTLVFKLVFGALSLGLCAVAYAAYRFVRKDTVFFVLVLGYLNTLSWVRRGWGGRGGNLLAFLTDPETLRIATLGAGVTALACLVVYYSRPAVSAALAAALGLLHVGGIVHNSEAPRMTLTAGKPRTAQQPDLYVLSFDALRKDVFDERCAKPRSDTWRRFCDRSTRFDNVLSAGLQTNGILKTNVGFTERCEMSLPGRLAQQGYASTFFYGSKLRTIPGWHCFDHFYSGGGTDLLGHFALHSVLELFGPKAPRLRFKFLDTEQLLEALRIDQGTTRSPLLAYVHALDLHAPYVSKARWYDDGYLSTVQEFMSRCYLSQCDGQSPRDRELIERARRAYLETVDDVEKHMSALIELAERRGRPFRVVLTADHGELFGEHGGFAHGGGFVPELLSVPFAVYDSKRPVGARDCTLLTTAEALDLALRERVEPPPTLVARESVRIEGPPLGAAVADRREGAIRFTIAPEYVRHRGTWRNVHSTANGSIPWNPARCSTTQSR